jgi:hypothetical protein
LLDTGVTGVRVNIGQENHILFRNDTGVTITNGYVLNVSQSTNGVICAALADNSSPFTSLSVIGVATADVLDGGIGLATRFGNVHDMDTSGLSPTGPVYLSTNGTMTSVKPIYPNTIVIMGAALTVDATNGILLVDATRFTRSNISESYNFTSQGIGSGTFWKAGFYEWPAADANLTQANLTQTLGTADKTYAAHVGIVPDAAGVVDTGVVGLRVTGIEDSETGIQVAAQTSIITADITTLTANVMAETSAKYSGEVTLELYVVSGSPVNYSLDCNYGYSKYSDIENRDLTITGFEVEWRGGTQTDTGLNITLMKHSTAGWTYAATGFEPGNGAICDRLTDQALASNSVSGEDSAYKRTALNEFIGGNNGEGYLIKIVTTQTSSAQTMDIHVGAVSEELTR